MMATFQAAVKPPERLPRTQAGNLSTAFPAPKFTMVSSQNPVPQTAARVSARPIENTNWQRKPVVFLHVSEEVFQADFVRPDSRPSLNVRHQKILVLKAAIFLNLRCFAGHQKSPL
jgi:hypothetical protein